MTREEIQEAVYRRVVITDQTITVMKGLLLKHFDTDTDTMLRDALKVQHAERPAPNTKFDADGPMEELILNVSNYLLWWVSAVEALHQLFGSGVLIPTSDRNHRPNLNLVYQDRGYSAGIDFPSLDPPPYPHTVMRTKRTDDGLILSDPNLYVGSVIAGVENPEIYDALKESIKCFRTELFLASVVMLGKASEGSWIEFGKAIALKISSAEGRETFRDMLNNPNQSFAAKLRKVMSQYERAQHLYKPTAKKLNVSLDDVRLAHQWSELVRDTRNSVHHDSDPNLVPTFENVSTLLLCGSRHLNVLHTLRNQFVEDVGVELVDQSGPE